MPGAASETRTSAAAIARFALSVLAQVLTVVLGVALIFAPDVDSTLGLLVLWCLVASAYAGTATIALAVLSRRPNATERAPTRLEVNRATRVLAFIVTILSSLVGAVVAVQVITLRDDPELGIFVDVLGVWAMLLSWGFLHWGFALLYFQHYYANESDALRFPDTPFPRLVDFVYFSYTVGTSFAASDVEVRTGRMRWRVATHSVLSFFFNGLIIVLALNTIINAGRS